MNIAPRGTSKLALAFAMQKRLLDSAARGLHQTTPDGKSANPTRASSPTSSDNSSFGLADDETEGTPTETNNHPSSSEQDASARRSHQRDSAATLGEMNSETNQQQTDGAGDDVNNGSNSGGASNSNSGSSQSGGASNGTDAGDMGSGGATNGEAAGGGAANPTANNPDEPRISGLTGAIDAGSIGANREFNRANNLGPWHPGYRVMEDDPRIQPLSRADELLLSVYGDTIHQNDGTHLNGGVRNDRIWQRRWLKVVSGDLKLWTPPRKHFEGKKFVNMFANELEGVRTRMWNSERAMLFAPVILNRKSGVVKASEITKTISLRLQL
jgi:hypothetical protein